MEIVVVSTSPERKEMAERPGEIITRMGIDSLEQPQRDPNIHRQDVKIVGQVAVKERSTDGPSTKCESLDGMSVFSRQTERSRVLVVQFVDVSVKGSIVKGFVCEVMPDILEDEEEGDLRNHCSPGRERNLVRLETEHFAYGMKEPDLGQLDGEVDEEDELGALPLIFIRRNFVWL